MKKTMITRTCDLHGGVEEKGASTILFGLGKREYELEACPEHERQMRKTLGRFVAKARVVR